MSTQIRLSKPTDLAFLIQLENAAFETFQQTNKRSLTNSLHSKSQEIWILEQENDAKTPIGALTLFIHKKSIRLYSIAIHPSYQNQGLGNVLLKKTIDRAKELQLEKITLEVRRKNTKLVDWYQTNGFRIKEQIKDYYSEGEDGIKMEITIASTMHIKTKNIIVANNPRKWDLKGINATIISVRDYIHNEKYYGNDSLRIFNLCSSYKYQTYGYYVSLLASARGQRVIPNATTICDFSSIHILQSISLEIEEEIQEVLNKIDKKKYTISIYFGQTNVPGFKHIATKLYQLFETPAFTVQFIRSSKWIIKEIKPINFNKLSSTDLELVNTFAIQYFNKKRFNKSRLASFSYDLAILIDEKESTPPSCPIALNNFKKAANKRGIYVEFITKQDFNRINEFDALFIRETTSVNNHTYEFSRLAYSEGLVVIDDPWSILKCSNKIYQNELFRSNHIHTPKTTVFTKNSFSKKTLKDLQFPLIIKQPDSAFSMGVIKVENIEDAFQTLTRMFEKTDMVISQEFTYSDFDWRIGVLDNKAIFACKYYMTKGHWQIYNWAGEKEEQSGNHQTLPLEEVPAHILKTAQKAASLIGDGLYGVDLKDINGDAYVIEVNDNPNIDAGIEDEYLKEGLYDTIIASFLTRIETYKNVKRYVSL